MEVPERLPLPAEEVEWNREESTDEETLQNVIIDGANAEHLLGSKGAPKDGCGKESTDTRTREVVLLVNRANTRDSRHLVVEKGRTDESGN